MTFDDRVRALAGLGFSEIQTRFIVTVALHSGFCLRRHYTAFAGLKYGQGVRDFLDRLVARRLARRSQFRPDRGHVYHVHNSAIYDAIGQDDNRNRRRTSAALIARKLMLFDYVLSAPADDWYVTEQDKVALFTTRFDVAPWELPQRGYGGRNNMKWRAHTRIRYFVPKLPIGVTGEVVTVVFLVTDTSGEAFRQFLQDHLRLLNRLPHWRIVAVAPCHIPGVPACELALRRLIASADRRTSEDIEGLRLFFMVRDCLLRNDMIKIGTKEINGFHAARARFRAPEFEALFHQWRTAGDSVLEDTGAERFRAALQSGRGAFSVHRLPLRYDRFGTRPGIS